MQTLRNDRDHLEQSLAIAQQEVGKYQHDWEGEILTLRKEREILSQRMQELVTQNEKLKIEGNRQVDGYK